MLFYLFPCVVPALFIPGCAEGGNLVVSHIFSHIIGPAMIAVAERGERGGTGPVLT
jgi:hypothetical protein